MTSSACATPSPVGSPLGACAQTGQGSPQPAGFDPAAFLGGGIRVPLIAAIGVAAVLAIAAVVFLVLWLLARRRPPRMNSADVGEAVISDLIALGDAAGSPALSDRVARTLDRLGVRRFDAAVGGVFDPDTSTAEGAVPTADARLNRTVATQIRPGWRQGDRIVRPATVTVWVTE